MLSSCASRVLVACDSFKGTLPSFSVGEAVEAGYRRYAREVSAGVGTALNFTHCPMSDGGAGLLDSLTHSTGCATHTTTTAFTTKPGAPPSPQGTSPLRLERVYVPESTPITGPLGTPLTGVPICFACDAARGVIVVEMAEASGLPRIRDPRQRNPLQTTSYGTGQIVRYAIEHLQRVAPESARRGVVLFLGIGGSATNDGGLGALQALGLDIFVKGEPGDGQEDRLLDTPFRGADLTRLTRVHISDAMRAMFLAENVASSTAVHVAQLNLICDVDNPLVGPRGATYTFGPQKCSPVCVRGHEDVVTEDAAVGEVCGEAQRRVLDSLEAGMNHAAVNVAASLWCSLARHHEAANGADSGRGVPAKTQCDYENDLLHAPGGGGAGGMSGFFRFVLGATFLPGADAVAELLNLRIATHNRSDVADTTVTGAPFTGLLHTSCDILVTGEGSFDDQTISSHKTVGRLLEMAVEANLYHRVLSRDARDEGAEAPLVKAILVVCGRCGFQTPQMCQDEVETALVKTLLPTLARGMQQGQRLLSPLERAVVELQQRVPGKSASDLVRAATPLIDVLPLAPQRFTVREAMSQPYRCVEEAVYQFFKSGSCDYAARMAARPPRCSAL